MERRTLLAGTATALAGLAGCLEGDGGRSPTDSPTTAPPTTDPSTRTDREDEETTATPASADVTVERVALQHGYVGPNSPDSIGLHDGDRQYLVADVAVDGGLGRDAFALGLDDERVTPSTPDRFYRTRWGDREWYAADRSRGLVLFVIPPGASAEAVSLTWPGGEHAVEGSIPDRIGLPAPSFDARFEMDGTTTPAEPPTVSIRVTSEEDTPRRFLGALNRTGPWVAYTPVARLDALVAPGETTTLTVDDDWYVPDEVSGVGDDETDLTYRLISLGGDATHDMRLVES